MALFDPLTTYGNFIQQKWILPVALVQILWETCVILSIRFCGSVDDLHAIQWGISHIPLPLATLHTAMHSHHLSWAASGDHQTCLWMAMDLPDSRKQKQWQLWLANCCVSTLNWLTEKSEECQSWHKGEQETWAVRREAREWGRQGQQWAGRQWPFWMFFPVSSPVWQQEQAMFLYCFLYTDGVEWS